MLLLGDSRLLGRDDMCVVIAIAIFMDRCSCRQKVRELRLRRLSADPLSTNSMKRCAMQSHVVALDFSLLFEYNLGTRRDGLCSLSERRRSVFL